MLSIVSILKQVHPLKSKPCFQDKHSLTLRTISLRLVHNLFRKGIIYVEISNKWEEIKILLLKTPCQKQRYYKSNNIETHPHKTSSWTRLFKISRSFSMYSKFLVFSWISYCDLPQEASGGFIISALKYAQTKNDAKYNA